MNEPEVVEVSITSWEMTPLNLPVLPVEIRPTRLGRMRCAVGWHRWFYTPEGANRLTFNAERVCSCCGRQQRTSSTEMRLCGLHSEPEYDPVWQDTGIRLGPPVDIRVTWEED